MTNQQEAAASSNVPEHLRGTDNASTVRAMILRIERLAADGSDQP